MKLINEDDIGSAYEELEVGDIVLRKRKVLFFIKKSYYEVLKKKRISFKKCPKCKSKQTFNGDKKRIGFVHCLGDSYITIKGKITIKEDFCFKCGNRWITEFWITKPIYKLPELL